MSHDSSSTPTNLRFGVEHLSPRSGPVVVAAADGHGVRSAADRQCGARVVDPGPGRRVKKGLLEPDSIEVLDFGRF